MDQEITEEPPNKKLKSDTGTFEASIDQFLAAIQSSTKNLDPVVDDSLTGPAMLIRVYIGTIKDPKMLSRTIQVLNERLPLKELQHLKRVRKKEVLLCPTDFLTGVSSIQQFMETNLEELKDVFEYFKELEVPFKAPILRRQFKIVNKLWSCNFHPNPRLEKLMGGQCFTTNELSMHKMFMRVVFEVARFHLQRSNLDFDDINATIIVDPYKMSIVAAAFDNRSENPIQHSAMLAIDNVAKTQGGGAWCTTDVEAIDKDLLKHLQGLDLKLNFGARPSVKSEDTNNHEGPYLCTGYDVYMLREACFMCAMGLVHARAKRIYFCLNNSRGGALISETKLQTVSSLNHHFEVYTGFL